jgi:hypothetical protein
VVVVYFKLLSSAYINLGKTKQLPELSFQGEKITEYLPNTKQYSKKQHL